MLYTTERISRPYYQPLLSLENIKCITKLMYVKYSILCYFKILIHELLNFLFRFVDLLISLKIMINIIWESLGIYYYLTKEFPSICFMWTNVKLILFSNIKFGLKINYSILKELLNLYLKNNIFVLIKNYLYKLILITFSDNFFFYLREK